MRKVSKRLRRSFLHICLEIKRRQRKKLEIDRSDTKRVGD